MEGDCYLVKQKLSELSAVGRCVVMEESPVAIRAYVKSNGDRSELARAIGQVAAAERWKIAELHTEEGRLDEVFRSITLPDTTKAENK
jgi:ABC-2 type transport system ATP-binding protein